MSRFIPSPRLSLTAAVVALAAFVAPAALRAQTTTDPKVFYACYVPSSGSVYRIKEADLKQECAKTTHVQFSWTDGPKTPGFSDIQTVYSTAAVVVGPGGGSGIAYAYCPAGYKVISGNYFSGGQSNQFVVKYSQAGTTGPFWFVNVVNNDPSAELYFRAIAQCVK